jgi:hypothetical protein
MTGTDGLENERAEAASEEICSFFEMSGSESFLKK